MGNCQNRCVSAEHGGSTTGRQRAPPTVPQQLEAIQYGSGASSHAEDDWASDAVPWSPWMSAAECLIRKQEDQLSLAEWLSDGDDDDACFVSTYEVRELVKKSARQICKGKVPLDQMPVLLWGHSTG